MIKRATVNTLMGYGNDQDQWRRIENGENVLVVHEGRIGQDV